MSEQNKSEADVLREMLNEANLNLSTAVESLKLIRNIDGDGDSQDEAEDALISILGRADYQIFLIEMGIE